MSMVQRTVVVSSTVEGGQRNAYDDRTHQATGCQESSFNTEDFLEGARERALRLLTATSEHPRDYVADAIMHEIPYLLRTTRALIAMNSSIWDRCQEYHSVTMEGGLPFSRVSIPRVKTRVVDPTNTTVQIETTVTSMDFGAPPQIPLELSDLVSVPMLPTATTTTDHRPSIFPDYASFLDRATLLRDEALVPFLVKLKEHLESVTVFLGNIEAWIMEPISQVHFLEDVFNGVVANVEIPKLGDLLIPCGDHGGDLRCCTVRHAESSRCVRCQKPYRSHHRGMSRHGTMTHLCDYHGRNVGSFIKPVDKTIELTYCHPCDDSAFEYGERASFYELSMDSASDVVKLEKISSQHPRLDDSNNSNHESHGGREMMMMMDHDLSDTEIAREHSLMVSTLKMTTIASPVY